jgi:hypothetical protein
VDQFFIFLPRAACAVDQFLFFTARSLHGGNHVLLLPRSNCAVLDLFVRRAELARQPTSPVSTVQTLRGGRSAAQIRS